MQASSSTPDATTPYQAAAAPADLSGHTAASKSPTNLLSRGTLGLFPLAGWLPAEHSTLTSCTPGRRRQTEQDSCSSVCFHLLQLLLENKPLTQISISRVLKTQNISSSTALRLPRMRPSPAKHRSSALLQHEISLLFASVNTFQQVWLALAGFRHCPQHTAAGDTRSCGWLWLIWENHQPQRSAAAPFQELLARSRGVSVPIPGSCGEKPAGGPCTCGVQTRLQMSLGPSTNIQKGRGMVARKELTECSWQQFLCSKGRGAAFFQKLLRSAIGSCFEGVRFANTCERK